MHIVNTSAFRAAAEAIANLCPCPVEGRVTADQVKVALGELLDIWPWSIFAGADEGEDVELAHPAEAVA